MGYDEGSIRRLQRYYEGSVSVYKKELFKGTLWFAKSMSEHTKVTKAMKRFGVSGLGRRFWEDARFRILHSEPQTCGKLTLQQNLAARTRRFRVCFAGLELQSQFAVQSTISLKKA